VTRAQTWLPFSMAWWDGANALACATFAGAHAVAGRAQSVPPPNDIPDWGPWDTSRLH
jgi:hypothetical protein